jgi:hypothetical protein
LIPEIAELFVVILLYLLGSSEEIEGTVKLMEEQKRK